MLKSPINTAVRKGAHGQRETHWMRSGSLPGQNRLFQVLLAFVLGSTIVGCGPAVLNATGDASSAKANRLQPQSGPVLKEYVLQGSKLQVPFAVVFDARQRLWFNSFYQYLGMIRSDGRIVAHRFQKWYYGRLQVNGGLTLGPDQRVWFTDYYDENFGVVESTGHIKQYRPFGTAYGYGYTSGIVSARGHLWMLVLGSYGPGESLVELDTTPSIVKVINLPSVDCWAIPITADSDGTLWIGNGPHCPEITRVTTDDKVTSFSIPHAADGVWAIASGPDGNVWFAAGDGPEINPYIGKMTPKGVLTTYPISDQANGITLGPNGNWWITMPFVGKVVTMSLEGKILAEYTLPGAWKHSQPRFQTGKIVLGPDGNLWFAEANRNKIGELRFSK
jgi:virginiamycin B lyase